MFKALIGKGHPEFSTNRQQDAQEFFLHLINMVEVRTGKLGVFILLLSTCTSVHSLLPAAHLFLLLCQPQPSPTPVTPSTEPFLRVAFAPEDTCYAYSLMKDAPKENDRRALSA